MKKCKFCGRNIWSIPLSKEMLCKTCYIPIMVTLKEACKHIKNQVNNIQSKNHANFNLETLSDLEERVLLLKKLYFSKGIKIEGVDIDQLLISIQEQKRMY